MAENTTRLNMDINPELLVPASREEKAQLVKMRESTTYWQDAWRRFKKNKVSMVSLLVIILLTAAALIFPMVMPYSYSDQFPGKEHLLPNASHWFGTDYAGRDVFVRVMFGARISLAIGIIASFIIVVIGTIYGAIAGFLGGKVDTVMMRIVDIIYSVPDLLLIILLSVVLKKPLENAFTSNPFFKSLSMIGPGLVSIFIVLSSLYWVVMARIVRGQVLSLKEQEYVTAARALGASRWRIIKKHLIPNCIGPIIVTATFQIPAAIFNEAFLSFIGLGVDAPMASLGSLTSSAIGGIYSYPYLLIFPASFISIIILAFNLLGDGLRDALDPRLKK